MSTTPIDNPFIIKNNPYGYSADDSSSVMTTPAVIDFSATKPVETVTTSDATSPIPLVKPKAPTEESKGLTIETTAKPTLDRQTMKWFGYTQAQWDALSDPEKQAKTEIALKGIVDAYNKHQKEIGSSKRLSYAKQVELYRDRTAAGDYDQVQRLTSSVKALKGKDQKDAISVAYQYEDDGNRNVAEKTMADDYVDYEPENVLVAAKETKNFSIKNQVTAADNAWLADNSLHKDLVFEYMSRDNEDVQAALASNVGNFGKDDNGDVTDEGKQIQYDCYKKIIGSDYDSVVTTAADNIWTMDKDNQVPAVRDIYATDNTDAKDAVAQNIKYYEDGTQSDIESIISDSDCDSAKGVLKNEIDAPASEEPYKNETGEMYDYEPQEEPEYAYSSEPKSEIDAILEPGATPSQGQIEKALSNATTGEKLAVLKGCNGNVEVIKALLSLGFTDEVIDYMNNNKVADKDQKVLVEMIKKSGTIKDSQKLGTAPSDFQVAYLAQLELNELNDVNRDDLSVAAKAFYDKRLNELNNDKTQTKFGLLIG